MRKLSVSGFGPVQLILAGFVISAMLRLGTQGMALAGVANASASGIATQDSQVCETPPDMGSLLATLKQRQEQIAGREQKLSERRLSLDAVEVRIAAEMQALTQAQEKLAATLAIADNAAENDLNRLTAVYENMKPKDAAGVFSAMDMTFAAGFLSRMQPKAAAGIMSAMPAEKAYSISVVMAGRNARAPTE